MNYLTPFGGTRFVAVIGAAFMTTLLQFFGKLDPQGVAYTAVVLGTVGALVTGNVVQTRIQAMAQRDIEVAKTQTGDTQQ